MKKVFFKDILKKGETLNPNRKISKKDMEKSMKYLKEKIAENERLKRIDPRTGDLFVGN